MICSNRKHHGMLRTICLPEVNLPSHESVIKTSDLLTYLNTFTVSSTVEMITLLLKIDGEIKKITKSKSKIDAKPIFEKIQNIFIASVIKNRKMLPSGYKYFGQENDNVKNLLTFVQSNPFFTSAITYNSNRTFSINCVPVDGSPLTYFAKIVSTQSDEYPRINATFRLDYSRGKEISIVELKEVSADASTKLSGKSDDDKAADLLFLLLFYSQCIHTLIHIFHYINIVTIVEATQIYPDIQAWSLPYLPNVAIKYVEVYQLLLPPKGGGVLNGGGAHLFQGGEEKKVGYILRDVLCEWGSYKTAEEFVEKFIFKHFPTDDIADSGLLVQFRKHVALINGYATDISEVFRQADGTRYHEANNLIEVLLSKTGHKVSAISDLPTWIELMSVTGLLHGCTLSYSRAFATYAIQSRFNPKGTRFTSKEYKSVQAAVLTIAGVIDDRHVFTSSLSTISPQEKKDCGGVLSAVLARLFGCSSSSRGTSNIAEEPLHPLAKSVLLRYDAASTALKEAYFKEIREGDPERFKNYGWILSDYFLDGMDGKQLTMASYI